MAAQEVAAAEMNWLVPCGNPVSKYDGGFVSLDADEAVTS
jgi:hypothetical protein